MKKNIIFLSIAVILICISCTSQNNKQTLAKYQNVITKYTEIKQIISKEVADTFYLYIRLPKHYESSNKRYPVLYLLDGDISFDMAASVVRYLQFGIDVPDLIIVAPGYGTLLNDKEKNCRERDYSISENNAFTESGGAFNYLNFIQKELIPLIDSNYRTNKKRILNGYSLGGLFTIYTLINSPQIFDGYIIGSPYLTKDVDYISENLRKLKIQKPKKVFITIGELEDRIEFHLPINAVIKNIKGVANINFEFREFAKGTHYTCPPEALGYGLKFIFN